MNEALATGVAPEKPGDFVERSGLVAFRPLHATIREGPGVGGVVGVLVVGRWWGTTRKGYFPISSWAVGKDGLLPFAFLIAWLPVI